MNNHTFVFAAIQKSSRNTRFVTYSKIIFKINPTCNDHIYLFNMKYLYFLECFGVFVCLFVFYFDAIFPSTKHTIKCRRSQTWRGTNSVLKRQDSKNKESRCVSLQLSSSTTCCCISCEKLKEKKRKRNKTMYFWTEWMIYVGAWVPVAAGRHSSTPTD